MKKITIFLFSICLTLQFVAQEQYYFMNPVIRGDTSDPSITRVGDTYYAVGISSEWAPFYPVSTSKDMVNQKQARHILSKQPSRTSNSSWASELFYHNSKIHCCCTARQKNTGISHVRAATSGSPLHKSTDHGPIITYDTEVIGVLTYDDNGQLYISWKVHGLGKHPIELLGRKLSADGLYLKGEPFPLLVDDGEIDMESQYHFKQGDYHYVVYSAHGCCGPPSNYDVYVARSKNFCRPYGKYTRNPVLHGGEGDHLSCGHGTVIKAPDGKMFYMRHTYLKGEGFYAGRQPVPQEMEMTADHWVRSTAGKLVITKQPMPFKTTIQQPLTDFEGHFTENELKIDQTWNYPYLDINIILKKRKLSLSGTPERDSQRGTTLCLRPQSFHCSRETKVIRVNKSSQGLILYGDDKNLITWRVEGKQLQLRFIKENSESILYESDAADKDIYLKIGVG